MCVTLVVDLRGEKPLEDSHPEEQTPGELRDPASLKDADDDDEDLPPQLRESPNKLLQHACPEGPSIHDFPMPLNAEELDRMLAKKPDRDSALE